MGPLRPSGLGRVDGRDGALTLPGFKTCLCARARLPGSACWAPEVVELLLRWVSVPLPPGDSVHLHTGAPELRSSARAVGGGIPGPGARRGLGCTAPLLLCTQQPPQPGMARGAPRAQAGRDGLADGRGFALHPSSLYFVCRKALGLGSLHCAQGWLQFPGSP